MIFFLEWHELCGGEDGFGFGLGEGVVVSFVFGGFDEELELGDLLAFHIEDDIAEGEEVLEV